ncbi:cGMP-dependent 3',5'-cyclic phosphodiesterase-like [Lagopus leucura]|uniref:cGMP-dependent 3',5'-cyclic phosphodiesterase-like n=1 Tax=Lagopus leucura TaxID=30410 RepID=UPI001C67B9D8|nr:cGMP-dependent 3',5'-cyclic phosphodiesterase-like [Lagopus leucura]
MLVSLLQVSDDEYTKLLSEGIQPVAAIDPNFAAFSYTPRSLPEDDTSMAILSMLQDMNFINTYKMDRQTLTRWGWDLGPKPDLDPNPKPDPKQNPDHKHNPDPKRNLDPKHNPDPKHDLDPNPIPDLKHKP